MILNLIKKNLFVFLPLILILLSSCSDDKECSLSSQCGYGTYCNEEQKCVDFVEGGYSVIFETPADNSVITPNDDVDSATKGIQIEARAALTNVVETLVDDLFVTLVVSNGDYSDKLENRLVSNSASFNLTLPVGKVVLEAYLTQNPNIRASIALTVQENFGGDVSGDEDVATDADSDENVADFDENVADSDESDADFDENDADFDENDADSDESDADICWIPLEIKIDSANPNLPTTNSSSMTIEFSRVEGTGTGETNFTCKLMKDNELVEETENCVSPATYAGLADGNFLFILEAGDSRSQSFKTHSWTVDTFPPQTIITSNPGDKTSDPSVVFEYISTKPLGATFFCQLEKEGESAPLFPYEDCDSGTKTYENLDAGNYTFSVYSVDSVGNMDVDFVEGEETFELSPAKHAWTIDFDMPLTSIISKNPEQNPTNINSMTLAFEANRESSFQCKLEREGEIISDWEDCSTNTKSYENLEDGVYLFSVKAETFYGNYGVEEGAPATYSWSVDTAAPIVEIADKPAETSGETGATFTFSANEEGATYECMVKKNNLSGSWTPCESPKFYSENSFPNGGSYQFSVRATDSVGNLGEIASYDWEVMFPVVSWLSPAISADGTVYVGSENNVGDSENYKINIGIEVQKATAGKNILIFLNEETTPLAQTKIAQPYRYYEYEIPLDAGREIHNLKILVEGKVDGVDQILEQKIVVNMASPKIYWAYPQNNSKFTAAVPPPYHYLAGIRVENSIPDLTVNLINSTSGEKTIIESRRTAYKSEREFVYFYSELKDSCDPQILSGELLDVLNGKTVSLSSIKIFYDMHPAEITNVAVLGAEDGRINIAEGENSAVTVNIRDEYNPADAQKNVKLYTDNGSGGTPAILLESLNNQGGSEEFSTLFSNFSLKEGVHTLKVEAIDCLGNISSKVLDPITVDLTKPQLLLQAPFGSNEENRRQLVAADDGVVGDIDQEGCFENVELELVSTEKISEILFASHTVTDYNHTDPLKTDISNDCEIDAAQTAIKCALPKLCYGIHKLELKAADLSGNSTLFETAYEVDAIAPSMEIVADNSAYPPKLALNFKNVSPQSSYAITFVNENGKTKILEDVVFEDADNVEKGVNLGLGTWEIFGEIVDNHGNIGDVSVVGNIVATDYRPEITLRKGYKYDEGAGTVINPTSANLPIWFIKAADVYDCAETSCKTILEIESDAFERENPTIKINGEPVEASSARFNEFKLSLKEGGIVNKIEIEVANDDGTTTENYFIAVSDDRPELSLVSPSGSSGGRILALSDDVATDYIELAEIGYGFADDAISGGDLNFYIGDAIVFETANAKMGTVKIENVDGTAVDGLSNAVAPIEKRGDAYVADFSNLRVADSNFSGQTDYDLIFKIVASPSGVENKYLVKLHVDLHRPKTLELAPDALTFNKLTGRTDLKWQSLAGSGNNSTFGNSPGLVESFDIRYQDYNESVCTINSDFNSAKIPLETLGATPKPTNPEGEDLSRSFFVNRLDNGKEPSDPNFDESDIHKNGNRYCFAIAPVDAVYASTGEVLVKNYGAPSVVDLGENKMNWSKLISKNPFTHNYKLRNLGDLDGDGLDDFAIADYYRSSSETEKNLAGYLEIKFSKGEKSFKKTGAPQQRLGVGISRKADFNGDGRPDFAYADIFGEVFVHLGQKGDSTEGDSYYFDEEASFSFIAKDNSKDIRRTMEIGDFNGDGCDDFAVSHPLSDGGGTKRGEIYLYFGKGIDCYNEADEKIDGTLPNLIYEGQSDDDQLGRTEIRFAGDLNGDGFGDFVFGAGGAVHKFHIAYGSDDYDDSESGNPITVDYQITINGLTSLGIYRVGYGDFNGDRFNDLVVAKSDEILIYFGSELGISATCDVSMKDIDILNYNYPLFAPSNFTTSLSHYIPDINGDGVSDVLVASQNGLIGYFSGNKDKRVNFYDEIVKSNTNTTLTLNYGAVYCDHIENSGACHILTFKD